MTKFVILCILGISVISGCRARGLREPVETSAQTEHGDSAATSSKDRSIALFQVACKDAEVVDDGKCGKPRVTCGAEEVYLAHRGACVPASAENACFAKGRVLVDGNCENHAYYAACIRKTGLNTAQTTTIDLLKKIATDKTCEGSQTKLQTLTDLDLSGSGKELDLRIIQDFRNLERVNAEKNRLKTAAGLENLKDLEKLNLSHNALANIDALSELADLEDLDLSDNEIKNIAPLANLLRLRELNLRNNDITSLTALTNMTNLKKLDLHGNGFLKDLRPLHTLQEIETLDIGETGVVDLSPLKDLFLLELQMDKSTIAGFTSDKVSETNCPVDAATSAVLFAACSALRGL